MSVDMHTIRFMLEEVKALVASQNYKAARESLKEMNQFYQEAELSHIALGIASDCLFEAEELVGQLHQRRQKMGFWNRLFRSHNKRNNMAFEKKTYPDFSWSISRHGVFSDCQRKYFYDYYAYHNGWLRQADEQTRTIYQLKKLTCMPYLVGTVIHDGIAVYLNDTSAKMTAESLASGMLDRLDRCLRESENRSAWLNDLKNRTMLQEFYYDDGISEDKLSEARNRIVHCCENFIQCPSYRSAKKSSFMQPEVPGAFQSFMLSLDVLQDAEENINKRLVKTFAIPDLIYTDDEEDILWIVDWKTGGANDDIYRQQLLVYGLYIMDQKINSGRQIAGRIEYLDSGSQSEFIFSENEILECKKFIGESVGAMGRMLSDVELNKPRAMDDFTCTEDVQVCERCNYRQGCRPAA